MAEQSVSGMTVNERLFHFGLFDRFDTAARSKDVSALVQVLLEAKFSDEQALEAAAAVVSDPKRYGY